MIYTYTAKNKNGEIKQGEIEADNSQKVYQILKKQEFYVTSCNEKSAPKQLFSFNLFNKVSLKDLAIFTKELKVMMKAGLSIVAALNAQAEQTENKKLAEIATKLAQNLKGGTSFSKALTAYPKVFSNVYINTIKSGEASGKLEDILDALAVQLEKDYDLQSKVKGAMVYPAFILTALVGVMIIILVYVVPSLTKLFKEMGTSLPLTTRIFIGISDILVHYWWVFLTLIILLIFSLKYLSKTKKGKLFLDIIKIKAPIFGKLITKINMAKFCRTSSTLIKAGLPILEVIKNSKSVINSSVYKTEFERAEKKVQNGVPLGEALKDSPYFPKMVCHLINIGEKSGNIEESFDTLGDYYEREVATSTAALSSLIEPILIVVIGIAAALLIISVIQPIYSLSNIL